ncbi:MAG: hypothetical protein ACR2OX_08090, partial [Methyloligellaceae bacterium]
MTGIYMGGALRLLFSLLCLSVLATGDTLAGSCDRTAYSNVFNKASGELTKMNGERARDIKRMLRDLKKLAAWSDQE